MSINNSNKPIGYNIRQDMTKQVGSTYGERRQHLTNSPGLAEPQQKHRDFSKSIEDTKSVEHFSSNATFISEKKASPHKVIETGNAHPKARINDNVRLAFLNSIISGPGENRHPTQINAPARPPLRLAATPKSPIRSTIRSTKA